MNDFSSSDSVQDIEIYNSDDQEYNNHIILDDPKFCSSDKEEQIDSFPKKSDKVTISNNNSNDKQIISQNICNYCNKSFTRKDNMLRHKAICCNEKLTIYQQKEIELMKTEMQKLKNELMELKCNTNNDTKISISNNNNNNNSNNITNNNNFDIKIMSFGKEDLYNLITDDSATRYIKTGYQSVYNLIEDFHFNEKHPERQNVYISNMKDPYAHIFDGDKWNIITKDEAVNQLFDDKQCFLISTYKNIKNTITPRNREKFERFMTEIDNEII